MGGAVFDPGRPEPRRSSCLEQDLEHLITAHSRDAPREASDIRYPPVNAKLNDALCARALLCPRGVWISGNSLKCRRAARMGERALKPLIMERSKSVSYMAKRVRGLQLEYVVQRSFDKAFPRRRRIGDHAFAKEIAPTSPPSEDEVPRQRGRSKCGERNSPVDIRGAQPPFEGGNMHLKRSADSPEGEHEMIEEWAGSFVQPSWTMERREPLHNAFRRSLHHLTPQRLDKRLG